MSFTPLPASAARGRPAASATGLLVMVLPALGVTLLLFGGGLALGMLQGLGHLPAAGMDRLSLTHFSRVFGDPDFFHSLGLTFYVSLMSTLAAAAVSTALALALTAMAERWRAVHFIVQIPLTVPHLVVAVAVLFLLAPSGFFSRLAAAAGIIDAPAAFPLLIHDPWLLGVMLAYVWKEIPFITLMVLAVLRNSGTELLEVGRTLKAGRWQRFRYIVLPTIFPSLGAACLIVFAYTFGAFEIPYLLGRTYPMLLPVWAWKNYSDVDLMARPEGIATGLVIAAVVVLCVVLSQILTRWARRRGVVL